MRKITLVLAIVMNGIGTWYILISESKEKIKNIPIITSESPVTSRSVFKSVVQRLVLSLWAELFKFRTTVPQVWLTDYRAASHSTPLTRGHLRCCRHWRGNAGSEEGERREYGEPRKRTQRWPARSRGSLHGGARPAHASTRLFSTRVRYDHQLSIIVIVIGIVIHKYHHVPATVLPEMEVPSQQSADHVLTAARATGLLRRHARLRGQDAASAQGK